MTGLILGPYLRSTIETLRRHAADPRCELITGSVALRMEADAMEKALENQIAEALKEKP